jgi:hypothetical protein
MKIKSSKVIQIGPLIYLAILETEEKHPWENELHWVKFETGVGLVDLTVSPDEDDIIWENDSLPDIGNDELNWEIEIISGTRYDLRFFIYPPSYVTDDPSFITEYILK